MTTYHLRLNGDVISEQTVDEDYQVGDLVPTGIRNYRVLTRTDGPDGIVFLDVEIA